MRKAIKKKWLEALRSGEYKQGKRTLRRVETDGGYSFCCLGVLCDLAVKEGVIDEPKPAGTRTEYGTYEPDLGQWASTGALPSKVVEWAFTKREIQRKGSVELTDPQLDGHHLSGWNDQRDKNFDEISDLIEEHLLMPTLRPEVKQKWTEALRSGKYAQGKGQLRDRNDTYCCLGVLCQVAVEEGVIEPPKMHVGWEDYFYGDNSAADARSGVLPVSVQEWAYEQSPDDVEQNRLEDPLLGDYHASNWNDDHKADFKKIALLVEEYL